MTRDARDESTAAPAVGPRRRLRRILLLLAVLPLGLLAWGAVGYRLHRVTTVAMTPLLRPGDRVLVRRSAQARSGPGRWDVVLVRPPDGGPSAGRLGRIVGLPGERIRLTRGELWLEEPTSATWRRLERPAALRERLYVPVYPWRGVALDVAGAFLCEGGWAVRGPGHLAFAGGTLGRATYVDAITQTTRADVPTTRGEKVDDLRVRLEVTPQAATDFELVWQAPAGWRAVLSLSTEQASRGQGLRVTERGVVGTQRLSSSLTVGRTTAVELEAVDGTVVVRLDGDVAARTRLSSRQGPVAESPQAQALALAARGGALEVRALRIDRNRAFAGPPALGGEGVTVPAGQVLVLGDRGPHALGDPTPARDAPAGGELGALVPTSALVGRAELVLWPLDRLGRVR